MTITIKNSKKRIAAIDVAALSLLVPGVAGSARKHFMLSNAARPEAKTQLSNSVERAFALVLLDSRLESLAKEKNEGPAELR